MIIVVWVISGILALWLIGNFFTYVIQDFFIFRPKKLPRDYDYNFNLPFEELTFETPYDGSINTLWFRNPEKARPVVLYYHGNSGDLSRWGYLGAYFDQLGYDLIIYDFRGFGKSKGWKNERNLFSDAEYLYRYALKAYSKDNIILFGRSMGTGMATYIASKYEAKMLILETPYFSIPDLFRTYYPFLPAQLFFFKYNFRCDQFIQKAKSPVHIFHGDNDWIIPLRNALRLKKLLKEDSSFTIIEEGRHHDLSNFDNYDLQMKKLLDY